MKCSNMYFMWFCYCLIFPTFPIFFGERVWANIVENIAHAMSNTK